MSAGKAKGQGVSGVGHALLFLSAAGPFPWLPEHEEALALFCEQPLFSIPVIFLHYSRQPCKPKLPEKCGAQLVVCIQNNSPKQRYLDAQFT